MTIIKPFSLRELVARAGGIASRRHFGIAVAGTSGCLSAGSGAQADPLSCQLLDLTLHEYRLLETLLGQPGKVFTRSQLLAWLG